MTAGPWSVETWLNGWKRNGKTVWVLNGQYCCGCGRSVGLASIVLTGEEPAIMARQPMPKWPFDSNDCPVCSYVEEKGLPPIKERLARFKAAKQATEEK